MTKKKSNEVNLKFTDDSYERLVSLVEKTKAKNIDEVVLRSLRLYEYMVNEAEINPNGELFNVLANMTNKQFVSKVVIKSLKYI